MKFSRFFKRTLIGLTVFIVIFIATLPEIVTTSFGKNLFLKTFNAFSSTPLSIESLQMSWWAEQKVKNLRYGNIFFIEEGEISNSLFWLIFSPNKLDNVKLIRPEIRLEKKTPLAKNLDSKGPPNFRGSPQSPWFPTIEGEFVLRKGKIELFSQELPPVDIRDISADYDGATKKLHVIAKTQGGDLAINGSFGKKVHLVTHVEAFPLSLCDELFHTHYFTKALGPTLNLTIESQRMENNYPVSIQLNTQNLSGAFTGQIVEKNLVLNTPASFQYTLTPTFFEQISQDFIGEAWKISENVVFPFSLHDGLIPLDFRQFDSKLVRIDVSAPLNRLTASFKDKETVTIQNMLIQGRAKDDLEISVTGQFTKPVSSFFEGTWLYRYDGRSAFSFKTSQLDLNALQRLLQKTQLITPLAGDLAECSLNGEISTDGQVKASYFLTSPIAKIEGKILARELKDIQWELKGDRVNRTSSPYLGERVFFTAKGDGSVEEGFLKVSKVQGKLFNPFFDLSLEANYAKDVTLAPLSGLKIQGKGTLKQLPPILQAQEISLNSGTVDLKVLGQKNQASLNAVFQIEDTKGVIHPLKLKVRADDFIKEERLSFNDLNLDYEFDATELPNHVIDRFLPEGIDLTPFVGTSLTLQSKGKYLPNDSTQLLNFSLSAIAPGFIGSIDCSVDRQGQLTQNKPALIHWELTPLRYAHLMNTLGQTLPPYRLSTTSHLTLSIPSITLPTSSWVSSREVLANSGIQATIQSDPLTFRHEKTNASLILAPINASIFSPSFSKNIRIEASGGFEESESSHFAASIEILNLWTPEGKFDQENFSLSEDIIAENLPVEPLVELIPIDPLTREKTAALLGERLNLNATSQIAYGSGSLQIDVNASNLKTTLPLSLSNGMFVLRNYVEAEIQITDRVSQNFLVDINPLLFRGVRSSYPIKLYISPQGFSCPLWIRSLKDITIERAILDIGAVEVENGPGIQELMRFLKSRRQQPTTTRAWFTPIFMSFKEGTAQYERFDILLGKDVHIAFWGKVDWIKGKVWMTLGIAPQTLKQRFNLIGLSKKDMFQVKMRGTTSKVDLDWSSAYTRIGILIARLAGGHIGYLVGGVVEQLITVLGEEPTPPPTTQPFPWESKNPQIPGEQIPEIAPPSSSKQQGAKKLLEFLIP